MFHFLHTFSLFLWMVNGPHLYSTLSALQCWLTFTHSCTNSHTDGGVNHAGWQPGRQEQLGWGFLLMDTTTLSEEEPGIEPLCLPLCLHKCDATGLGPLKYWFILIPLNKCWPHVCAVFWGMMSICQQFILHYLDLLLDVPLCCRFVSASQMAELMSSMLTSCPGAWWRHSNGLSIWKRAW